MKKRYGKRELLNLNYKTATLKYGTKLMEEFPERFNWEEISENAWENNLNEEFITMFKDNLVWNKELKEYILQTDFSEEFVESLLDKFDSVNEVLKEREVSEEFIRKYIDRVDFYTLSCNQFLSNKFIIEYADRLFFDKIIFGEPVDNDTFEIIKDKIDYNNRSLNFDRTAFTFVNQREILSHITEADCRLYYIFREILFTEEIALEFFKKMDGLYSVLFETQYISEKTFWKYYKKWKKENRRFALPESLDPTRRNTCFTENWSEKFKKFYFKHNRKYPMERKELL